MAQLALNQNALNMTPMLGAISRDRSPATFPCRINPSSTAPFICAGCVVKLIDGTGPDILVDVCSANTDGPCYGVIVANPKKNIYAPGDMCEVVGEGGVIFLETGAAIARALDVSSTPPSATTNDPIIASDVTATHFTIGKTLAKLTAAGLVPVVIKPAVVLAGPVYYRTT